MSGWTVRFYWRDNDLMQWSLYEKHLDVTDPGEAGLSAGVEVGRMSVGSITVLVGSLLIIPDSLPRSAWPTLETPVEVIRRWSRW